MTTKQELQEKLDELEKLKTKLLRIEPFLDSNNDSFVYSAEDLSELSGTQGTTPSNLGEILETIVKEINKYVEYIKKLPYAESSVIYRDRPEVDLALVSSQRADFHPPIVWEEKAVDVDIDSVSGYLPMSEFYGKVKTMRIYSSPTMRKGDISGRDIDIEVKLLRVNNRLNIKSEFRSGTGPLDVTITDDVLAPDDIYILGIMNKETVSNNIVYYEDLTYSIEYTFFDGTESKDIFTLANKRIGNMTPYIDDTLSFGCVYWDLILLSRFSVQVENSIGDSSEINPFIDGPISGGLFDGNILTKLTTGMFSTDVSSTKLSYRSGCSWVRCLLDDKYTLYDKNTSNVAGIIFNNLRPIDRVIEEALNAL